MNDIIRTSYMESSSKKSKGFTPTEDTDESEDLENILRVEPLQSENQQATESLVDRMINDHHDKVNPGVRITKSGVLDLNDNHR